MITLLVVDQTWTVTRDDLEKFLEADLGFVKIIMTLITANSDHPSTFYQPSEYHKTIDFGGN